MDILRGIVYQDGQNKDVEDKRLTAEKIIRILGNPLVMALSRRAGVFVLTMFPGIVCLGLTTTLVWIVVESELVTVVPAETASWN